MPPPALFTGKTAVLALAAGAAASVALRAHRRYFASEPVPYKYPVSRRDISVRTVYHASREVVPDPYRWLENPDSEETRSWVEAQNEVTDAHLRRCRARGAIQRRNMQMLEYERFSVPFSYGRRIFHHHNSGLQNQSVLYVQEVPEGASGAEVAQREEGKRVLLDPNTLASDGTAALGTYGISEDGEWLAYGVSRSGSDWQTISVRRIADGVDLDDRVEWVKFSGVAWTHDHRGFFYSRYPTPASLDAAAAAAAVSSADPAAGTETDESAGHAVYYHRIGTPQSSDVLVFQPENRKWTVGAEVSDDGRTLLLTTSSSCDPVNHLFVRALPGGAFTEAAAAAQPLRVVDEFVASYDYITNVGERFWFKTNLDAPRYRVVSVELRDADVAAAARGELDHAAWRGGLVWREVLPQHATDVLEYVRCTDAHSKLLAVRMHDVKHEFALHELDDGRLVAGADAFRLPTMGTVSGISGRPEQREFFFQFVSFLSPGTVFHVSLAGGAPQLRKVRESRIAGVDPELFHVEQVFYPAKNDPSVRIPMYIVHRRDLVRDGRAPTLLYGYGGFSISLLPTARASHLLWVQHFNGVAAIPNLRGGGEYGEDWHKAGCLANKQNVFDDFQGAAEFLVRERYTEHPRIAIHGGSNGGLLVAACVNQRPELFGAAVAAVGVMDMLRFHKFTIGSHWCSDYGNAEASEAEFDTLRAYSPLHNVRTDGVQYPALMLTTADHDDRVVPLHSYKLIAELQHRLGATNREPLLIRIECKAGHGAGKPLAKVVAETADVLGFFAKHTGAVWRD